MEQTAAGDFDPELRDLLRLEAVGFHVENLETDWSVIYMLSPDLRILYCNQAWDDFAHLNGGVGLERKGVRGTAVLSVVAEPLRKFYSGAFERTQAESRPWEHDYECSSPQLFREFRMRVLPLGASYLLVENSLRVERPHDRNLLQARIDPASYVNDHAIITMCCHCRRTRRVDSGEPPVWDWVPQFLVDPPAPVSHGLCANCRAFFYNDPRQLGI